jgi:hypothetical protein
MPQTDLIPTPQGGLSDPAAKRIEAVSQQDKSSQSKGESPNANPQPYQKKNFTQRSGFQNLLLND